MGSNKVYLIDAGNTKLALESLKTEQALEAIFLTHDHYDHIADIHHAINRFPNCMIYCSSYTQKALADSKQNLSFYHGTPVTFAGPQLKRVKDQQLIPIFDNDHIEVIETPGHTEGSLSFKCQNNLFTGDALIPNLQVVTKLRTGNKIQARESIQKIKKILKRQEVIWAGHGDSFTKEQVNWEYYLTLAPKE